MPKIQEIVNKELYDKLIELQPKHYFKSVGNQEETRVYLNKLFNKIYSLLLPFNPKLIPSFYHLNKSKKKIELWEEPVAVKEKVGKKLVLVKKANWIEVYEKGGTQEKNDQKDWGF